jgi:hypothetical protein
VKTAVSLPSRLYLLRIADTVTNRQHGYWTQKIGEYVRWEELDYETIGPGVSTWGSTPVIINAHVWTTRREVQTAQKLINNFDTVIVVYELMDVVKS